MSVVFLIYMAKSCRLFLSRAYNSVVFFNSNLKVVSSNETVETDMKEKTQDTS